MNTLIEDIFYKKNIIQKIVYPFKRCGKDLYLVGGAIRDCLLSRDFVDYDFIYMKGDEPLVLQVARILNKQPFLMGNDQKQKLPTYRIVKDQLTFDFTLLSGESVQEDLARRDFTMNSIALSLLERSLIDPFDGINDIDKRIIRMVSCENLLDDPLRMLRAIRYLSVLDKFNLGLPLERAILANHHMIQNVSRERVRSELDQILLSDRCQEGIEKLVSLKLIFDVFPEMGELSGCVQGDHHQYDVFSHTIEAFKKADSIIKGRYHLGISPSFSVTDQLTIKYAALFHDLGKPFSKTQNGNDVHFFGHETVSADIAQQIMDRLRFAREEKKRIVKLIKHHMRFLSLFLSDPKEKTLRKFVYTLGEDTEAIICLAFADLIAHKEVVCNQRLERFKALSHSVLEIYTQGDVTRLKPIIRGKDLLDLGYKEGSKVGEILRVLLDMQIAGEITTKEDALKVIKERF